MKQVKFYAMMLTAAAITLLSACGGEEEVKPDPSVNFKTTSGYVFAMKDYLPSGLKGLMLVGFIVAFGMALTFAVK